jgi:hypothetical protein
MFRSIAAGLILSSLLAAPASAQAPQTGAQGAEVVQRIAALKTKGGSDAWDDEVEAILLSAYDRDGSKEIDTEEEVAAVPCEVWQQLDRSIRAGGGKDDSLVATYGFGPKGDYDGDALGIAEKLRNVARGRIEACGVAADR